ncbi:MAG: hypothetical protein IPL46_18820 [Saprospiraceae bacterium]|nr:hypothetical protein [Saprospiraceae bacterium]
MSKHSYWEQSALRRNLSLSSIVCFTSLCFAQKLNFVNYSVEQGLAQSQAQQIIQDDYGFLWISTLGGISRFDGKSFTNFYKRSGLNSQIVYCLHHQQKVGLWIGNHNGLQIYNGRKFESLHLKTVSGDQPIINILTDRVDHAYAINAKGNLLIMKNDSLMDMDLFIGQKFKYLAKDKRGHVYGVSTRGIYNLSDNSKLYVDIDSMYTGMQVNKFYFDNNNNLWLISDKGLYAKGDNGYSLLLSSREVDSDFTSIVQDGKQRIWVGSTKGAYRIDPDGSVKHIGSLSGLTDNTVNDIIVDRENNLWFATDADGIFKLPPNELESFDASNGLPGKVVMGMAKDKYGVIWIGTLDGGLSKYENGSFEDIRLPSRKAGAHKINSVYYDSENRLWFGTLGDGLWRMENGRFDQISTQDRYRLKTIISISEDAAGTLWITTPSGLYYFSDGLIQKIEGIDDACFGVLEKSRDTLLIGSAAGLFQVAQKSKVSKIGFEEHDMGTVNCFLKMDTCILLGTEDDGIFLWNTTKKSVKQYSSENGLPSDFIFSMYRLDSNTVLVGTGKGLSTIRLQDEGDKFWIRNITSSFSPYGPECNLNAILNAGNDRIWVGTTKGIYNFNAHDAVTTDTPPLIYLRSVSIFSKNIVDGQVKDTMNAWSWIPSNPIVNHKHNHLTFDFNAVAFSNLEGLRYQYKLVGADSAFAEPINTSTVIYPNLAPGIYRFRAFALTMDNLRSTNEIDFPFVIIGAFYQTGWFRTLLVVLFISLGFLLQYGRLFLKRKRLATHQKIRWDEQRKILERTSEDLHDDLGNKITRITVLTDVLRRKVGKDDLEKTKLLDQITENAQALYLGTKDIIWSLTPGKDKLFDTLEKCQLMGIQLFEGSDIEFEVKDIVEGYTKVTVPLTIARNLSMIIKEAFANIIRHSGATKATMSADFSSGNVLKIEIADNGKGLDSLAKLSGNGLQNMDKRMERIGGSIIRNNVNSGGFTILLTVKIPRKSDQTNQNITHICSG